MNENKKKYTPQQAQLKAEYYCAYQDRCQSEVRNKLYEWGLFSSEVENIICNLITENFLNEERFALNYARGKFKLLHWGKNKIKYQLKQKNITERLIQKAILALDDEAYEAKLKYLIEKKKALIKEKNPFLLQSKLQKYLYGMGYETDLINFQLKKSDL